MSIFRVVISFLLLCIAPILSAQLIENNYFPISDYKVSDSINNYFQNKYRMPQYKLSLEGKKAAKEYKKISNNRSSYFNQLVTKNRIMYGDSITLLLQMITDDLVKNNPELNTISPTIFTKRSTLSNASSLDEGAILFNIGLLERLNSIDQIAFIIGHELAHDYLNHVYQSIESIISVSTDKTIKKDIKKASKQEYGSNSKVNSLILSLLSNKQLHSRNHEYSADSLGLRFMLNAGFKLDGALETLAILKESDYVKYLDTVNIVKHLNTKEYPFKESWITNSNAGTAWEPSGSLYSIPDSLKTHPNCDLRAAKLTQYGLPENISSHNNISSLFNKFKESYNFESVQVLMDKEEYGLAMYYAIQLLEDYPDNIFLLSVLADSQIHLAKGFKNYSFSYYVDFPNKQLPPSYNELLTFLHNMSSKRLVKLFKAYYSEKLIFHLGDPYVDYLALINKIIITNSDTEMTEEEEKQLIDFYKETHGKNSYYYKLINYLN